MPGADPADFFNYGLNINSWKEYVGRIHQFRLEFSMQKKIQTYESSADTPALPPELAAAVAQGRQARLPILTICGYLHASQLLLPVCWCVQHLLTVHASANQPVQSFCDVSFWSDLTASPWYTDGL